MDMSSVKSSKPAFKGLAWYRETHFSFFIPVDWHQSNWPDGRQGVIYRPIAEDKHTLFAVDLKDLGLAPTVDDLEDLSYGFLSAIKQLPDRKIDTKDKWVKGDLMGLEARYTFSEDGTQRKRWVRVLYHGTRQIAFTAQGASVPLFDYWLPMFYETMMTANVHHTKPGPNQIA